MALHNIKIVVVDGGKEGSYKSKNAGVKDDEKTRNKNSPLYKLFNLGQTAREKFQTKMNMSPTTVFAMNYGMQIASQLVKQTASYFISDIGRSNGDSALQASINRQIEQVTDALSLVGGALAGAQMGSALGPVGAGVGAVGGLASAGISLAFKYAERERDFNFQRFKEENSLQYQRARANINLTTGRLR